MELAKIAELDHVLKDKSIAHLMIDNNRVLSRNAVKGLNVDYREFDRGVEVKIVVDDDTHIEKPVHLCFGLSKKEFLQEIRMDIRMGKNSRMDVFSHCVLTKKGKHVMNANIVIGEGARYKYLEKHIHGDEIVEVSPKAMVEVKDNGRFQTDFELLRGRVGVLDIDYRIKGYRNSIADLTTKVSGARDDVIKIREEEHLIGERARGVLRSRVAVRNNARAEIYNRIVAIAPFSRGHVDCKEIIKDSATAAAIPVVEVRHPRAHVTHEASIGSVDRKQLETLMSRGLSEDEATEIIIEGLLS